MRQLSVSECGAELMQQSVISGAQTRTQMQPQTQMQPRTPGHAQRQRCVRATVALLGVAWLATAAFAVEDYETLPDPEQQARYSVITHEVRCLTCLNRSIADSETPLANDLRREIRELIASGSSDEEVIAFLTERYGDFIMYRPPVRPRTWALWGGPFVFLLIGAAVFGRIVYRRMRQPIEDDAVESMADDDADSTDEGAPRG
jgi:cytochrome c-type biogenesis protein CcmH